MESNQRETAVEWLVKRYLVSGNNLLVSDVEQAKQMEKEQITDAYNMGSYDMAEKKFEPEQYYNETYNK